MPQEREQEGTISPNLPTLYGRDNEIDAFRGFIRYSAKGITPFNRIWIVSGLPGSGKTALLQQYEHLAQENELPHASINFENFTAGTLGSEFSALAVIDELAKQLNIDLTSESDARGKVHRFVKTVVETNTETKPVVLLFDSAEKVTTETRSALENIFLPFISHNKALIIWSGLSERDWSTFELRNHTRQMVLSPLAKADALLMAGRLGVGIGVAERIFQITGGHPGAIQAIAEEAAKLVNPNIVDLAYGYVENHIFAGLTEDEQTAIKKLSLERFFANTIEFRELLLESAPEQFLEYENKDFGELLGRIKRTGLVEWDDTYKSYTVDPIIRRMISRYFMAHYPQEAMAIGQAFIKREQHDEMVAKDSAYIYIAMELYQTALLNQISGEPTSLALLLVKRLTKFTHSGIDGESFLSKLYKLISEDPEMREVVGEKGIGGLGKIIQERLHSQVVGF